MVLSLGAMAQCNPSSIFSNTTTNAVCTEVMGAVRYFYSNSLPDHSTGTFPNGGNPHSISAQQLSITLCAYPENSGSLTYLDQGSGNCPYWEFGVATNGLVLDPIAAEYFENPSTGQLNTDWNLNALSSNNNLGLDFNDAHVQPSGKYHYHGFPDQLAASFGVTAGSHSPLIGYAADGYPVYGKYGYSDPNNANSSIAEVTSSYRLKSGTRPGNGTTAPNGPYDGTYTQDYEYVSGLGDLDECNGRTGVTPEYPGGTYYYVLTGDFPVIPRCLRGNPDNTFTIGPGSQGCGTSNASSICNILGLNQGAWLADQINMYPNPPSEELNIQCKLEIESAEVFDMNGRSVLSSELNDPRIDVSQLEAGTYFVQFKLGQEMVTKSFVKN